MSYMFGWATAFNQPLNFDVSSVDDFSNMFYGGAQALSNCNKLAIHASLSDGPLVGDPPATVWYGTGTPESRTWLDLYGPGCHNPADKTVLNAALTAWNGNTCSGACADTYGGAVGTWDVTAITDFSFGATYGLLANRANFDEDGSRCCNQHRKRRITATDRASPKLKTSDFKQN